MIETIQGRTTLYCDHCGDFQENYGSDFSEWMAECKSDGWRNYFDEKLQEWINLCGACNEKKKERPREM